MKKQNLITAIYALVVTIVASTYSFLFLTDRKQEILDSISITYFNESLPNSLLSKSALELSKRFKLDKDQVLLELSDVFSENIGANISFFHIENRSNEIARNIEYFIGDSKYVFVIDANGRREIETTRESTQIDILPNDDASIVSLKKSWEYKPEERFLLENKDIPINILNPKLFNDQELEIFIKNNAFVLLPLSLIGLIFVILIGYLVVINTFMKNSPAFLEKNTDVNEMAKNLALINWVKGNDYEKYRKIVSTAEKKHSNWSKKEED